MVENWHIRREGTQKEEEEEALKEKISYLEFSMLDTVKA